MGHHLRVLEEACLVRVVRTRRVRAMTEKYYGNTYRRVTFTARNSSWREELPVVEPFFQLRQAMDEYDQSALSEGLPVGEILPSSVLAHARVPASEAEKFAAKIGSRSRPSMPVATPHPPMSPSLRATREGLYGKRR